MKVKVYKIAGEFYSESDCEKIPHGKIQYFKRGSGWRRTALFSEMEIEVPDCIPENYKISDLITARNIQKEFGDSIALKYAIPNNSQPWKDNVLHLVKILKLSDSKLKALDQLNAEIFQVFDSLMVRCGIVSIDVIELDRVLSNQDPEYNDSECTYKGKAISTSDYIKIKYGVRINNIINSILLKR